MSLARHIATVGSGTLVSRLLAYVRDAAIAALLGTGPFAEAFFAVLQVVNFFRRLLAEGALNSAFVPIWLRLAGTEDGAAKADRFTIRTLVTAGAIAGAIALLVVVSAHGIICVIAPGFDATRQHLAVLYLTLVAPYVVLAGLVAVISAALNAEHRVAAVAISMVMFNLVLVGLLAYAMLHRVPLVTIGIWLSTGIVSAALIQLMITSAAWLSTGKRFRRVRAADRSGTFFARALPGLIAAGAPQLKLIAATAIVSSSPAAVSWLYYANRLYELPLGLASVVIAAVIVPRIAASLHTSEPNEFVSAQSRAYEIALGLALPAAAGFALLAQQIAGGLFEHGAFGADDTTAVAAILTAICAGLPGHVLEKVFAAVSFAHEDTHTPMRAALAGLAAAVIGCFALFPIFGYVGVAVAIALSAWVGAGLLGFLLSRRGWLRLDTQAQERLPRIVGAVAAMGVVVSVALTVADLALPALAGSALGRLGVLLALVVLGVLVYAAALDRLGVARIPQLIAALRRRG